ncbi:MAG: uroporphyrinogen-III C-methyltransferase [Candidatus Altiarchaeia archaeon]
MEGRVYLIGCGLKKEHLTMEAEDAIKECDTVLYDRLMDNSILELFPGEKIYVGKEKGESLKQDAINKLLLSKAKEGKTVGRLKAGDPFLFARGFEELSFLKENGIGVKVFPGLSAFSILSALNIPLTHRKYSSSVSLITGSKAKAGGSNYLGLDADTLVFYMPVSNLEKIVEKVLEKKDRKTRCLIVENACREDYWMIDGSLENIVDLAREAVIEPPSLLVIGNVLKLRALDLKGKNVLSFRQKSREKETRDAFRKLGAKVVNVPVLDVRYRNFDIPKADVYAFTSINAVRSVLSRYNIHGSFVAIGKRTQKEIAKYKKRSTVPDMQTSTGLEKFLEERYAGKEICVFCSQMSRIKKFRKIAAYDVRFRTIDGLKEKLAAADVVYFSSAEILSSVCGQIGKDELNKHVILVIGPATCKKAKELGVKVDHMLENPEI